MKSNELCIAKINNVSGTICIVELIFNGATEVVKEEVRLDVAAHIEEEQIYDAESGVYISTSRQVGEAGYKPFIDKLKEMYPNVQLIESKMFDDIVELQKVQASSLEM